PGSPGAGETCGQGHWDLRRALGRQTVRQKDEGSVGRVGGHAPGRMPGRRGAGAGARGAGAGRVAGWPDRPALGAGTGPLLGLPALGADAL
ncbi:hypothetical protein PSU20_20840, partial [Yersinia pestis]|nr:hypothetical protein [Yersinia pestis]